MEEETDGIEREINEMKRKTDGEKLTIIGVADHFQYIFFQWNRSSKMVTSLLYSIFLSLIRP